MQELICLRLGWLGIARDLYMRRYSCCILCDVRYEINARNSCTKS